MPLEALGCRSQRTIVGKTMANSATRKVADGASRAAIGRACLALPGVTKNLQWGNDLVFKVAGKMFAVMGADPGEPTGLSFKAGDGSFEILTRMRGIVPAPYLARARWVRLDHLGVLPLQEVKEYLARSHALVAARLTKKQRAEIGLGGGAAETKKRPAQRKTAKPRTRR